MSQPAISKDLKVLDAPASSPAGAPPSAAPAASKPSPSPSHQWLVEIPPPLGRDFERIDALLDQMKLDQLKTKEKETPTDKN